MDWDKTRPGEREAALPAHIDAGLVFIGVIRTPLPPGTSAHAKASSKGRSVAWRSPIHGSPH